MRFLIVLSFLAFLNLNFAFLPQSETITQVSAVFCGGDDGDCDGGCPLPPDDDNGSGNGN